MTNRSKWLVIALCGWTVFVWGNRLSNTWSSTTETTSGQAISTVLAASFLAFALAGVIVVVRAWSAPLTRTAGHVLLAFAGWTVVVWCVRIVAIAVADHSVGFKVVHAALGLISIGLSLAMVRSLRGSSKPISTAV